MSHVIIDDLVSTNEGSTLLVQRDSTSATTDLQACGNESLTNPHEGKDGESEGRPMNECAALLLGKYRPEIPSNSDASGQITLGSREGVGGGCGLEEEEGKEDKDLGPDASVVGNGVNTERGECGEDDKDGCPAMVEGERKVDEDLVCRAGRLVILFDNVVDVGNRRGHEQGEDKCDDVVVRSPQVDIHCVENGQQGEAPRDALNDGAVTVLRELVQDSTEEEEMNDRPDQKRPWRGSKICNLATMVVDAVVRGNGADVRAQE